MPKFLFIFTFITLLPLSVQAAVLTIDQEPPQLIQLKQDYAKQKKASITPQKLQQQYEKDTAKALNSPAYMRQKSALDAAESKEIQAIKNKYQAIKDTLKNNTMQVVESKHKALRESQKQNAQKEIQARYIASLKELEDEFIRQGNLAEALVVQTERKQAMQNAGSTVAEITPRKTAPKPIKVVTPAPKAAVKKVAVAPAVQNIKKSSAVPKTYSSTKQGFAGSGENNKNNSYSFTINPTPRGAELFFHAYGRKSNDSTGDVYLTTPDGSTHKVADWSPEQLQKTSFYAVSAAEHVAPITADISKYVDTPGTYKIEFVYSGGLEALIIYQAGIKTR
ncbi:MAG: hypothetical protein PF442_03910 [Desulfobulbaceae bacterium]|jgi:hypothetical protein|nr:hypothetical protein [Desulfobulbaceae bacterium]